jgi:peptidoglycan/LPS O-acetylase OafA/YrhL
MLMHRALQYLDWAPEWTRNVVAAGYTGVSLFFVLSGFVLAYTYLERGDIQRIERRMFWAARFARVYPVYLVSLLVALPAFAGLIIIRDGALLGPETSPGKIALTTLTLTHAWSWTTAWQWNSPGWSLSAEAFFYCMFPLIVPPLLRQARGRLLFTAGALWLLALLPPVLYLLCHADGGIAASRDGILMSVKFNPVLRIPEFAMGVVLGKLFLERPAAQSNSRWAGWMSETAAGVIVALLAMSPALPFILLHNGLLAPAFGLLIFGLACGRGPLARILSHPGLLLLGEASYALYLLHQPLWWWVTTLKYVSALDRQPASFFVGYVVITLLASVVVLQLVEKPCRKALRQKLAPGVNEAPAVASPLAA